MTSNAEQHANPPAAAPVRPPKATKSAHVRHTSAVLRPASRVRERKPAQPNSGPNAKRPPSRPNPPGYPRG
jgi:hypothetical protein